jgi:hypothetical protein
MQGIGAAGGSTSRNFNFRFNYKRTTNANPLSETVLETAFNGAPTTAILAALNIRFTQTLNVVRFVEDAQRPAVSVSRVGTGAVTGDGMPMHNAAFILKRMGIRGRGAHGSNHFGPLSESDTTTPDADILNAAAITRFSAIITAINATLTDGNGNIWVPVVLSRVKPAQYKSNPTNVVTFPISQMLLNKRIGRMKRRERGSVY